ncbi:MAG: glutamine-hydrolyzing carbamoyl-phosphate synthase small subunit [Cellvibrionales bacterium]|nr:glutamine-hydrolyzing carbamoyl-phosphate synthase small subunit [Cellvibrionales bacterium]
MKAPRPPAILALADGSIFRGQSIGAAGVATGELVFNTAMTGYQEILTDPSYAEQLVTLTYPHIGNVGTNAEDAESAKVWCRGLIIRDLPLQASNFRSQQPLDRWLRAHNLVAIAEVDTRRLTRLLRERGAQNGCLMAGDIDAEQALARARAFPGIKGLDLARQVSIDRPCEWTEGTWRLGNGYSAPSPIDSHEKLHERSHEEPDNPPPRFEVAVYDFGVKYAMLRLLVERGCRVTLVPATTPAREVLQRRPHGVLLSNGPGDPEPCTYAIAAIAELLAAGIPLFGICLGHQLLALAAGARTRKMKFGHHGANHPVQDLQSGTVLISSQNHGFAVDEDSLPATVRATHRSLFDGSLQGIEHTEKPAFGFQGHPEASPGPQDAAPLFDRFIDLMARHRTA